MIKTNTEEITNIEEMTYKSFKKYRITVSQFSVGFFSYYIKRICQLDFPEALLKLPTVDMT